MQLHRWFENIPLLLKLRKQAGVNPRYVMSLDCRSFIGTVQ